MGCKSYTFPKSQHENIDETNIIFQTILLNTCTTKLNYFKNKILDRNNIESVVTKIQTKFENNQSY